MITLYRKVLFITTLLYVCCYIWYFILHSRTRIKNKFAVDTITGAEDEFDPSYDFAESNVNAKIKEYAYVKNKYDNMHWVYAQKSTLNDKINIFNEIVLHRLLSNIMLNFKNNTPLTFSPKECFKKKFKTIVGLDAESKYTFDGKERLTFNNIQTIFLAWRNDPSVKTFGSVNSSVGIIPRNIFYPCVEAPSMTKLGGYTETLSGKTKTICHDKCTTNMEAWLSSAPMPHHLLSADYEHISQYGKCNQSDKKNVDDYLQDILTSLDIVIGQTIVHRNGAVYIPSGHVIYTHCCNPSMNINQSLPFKECETLKPTGELKYCDEIFVLTQQHAMENYFHTLIEHLPRAAPFVKFLRAKPEICLHVPRREGSNLAEKILRTYGLENKIIDGHSTANVVYIPHGGGCHQVNLVNTQLFTQINHRYLLNKSPIETNMKPTAILLKRSRRKLENHEYVLEQLKIFCMKHDIECVVYDDKNLPSYEETMMVFKRAVLVIGSHGAGLSNIVFCQPGAVVIEVQCDLVARPCFRNLANKIGLRFYGIMTAAKSDRQKLFNRHCNKDGVTVDPSELHQVLQFLSDYFDKLF